MEYCDFGNKQRVSGVIWITGLSGSGKTTLAEKLVQKLRTDFQSVIMLDGDLLREALGITGSHSQVDRLALAKKYSRLCKMLASQGTLVVIATISLFREVHVWNRKYLPNYIEVYLKVPLSELKKRDTKGIYKNYETGKENNVFGLDLDVDEPLSADWIEVFDPERNSDLVCSELLHFTNMKLLRQNQ